MNKIQTWLSSRTGRLVEHDGALAAGAGITAWQASGGDWTWGAFTAAGVVAGKFFLRALLPVPASRPTATTGLLQPEPTLTFPGSVTYVSPALNTWDQNTAAPSAWRGKPLGHLPSPRDDRDHKYKATVKVPKSLHNGAGLTYDALGNLTVGDCGEAGEEHGRQIVAHLDGGKDYTPTQAGTLALYSAITGYNPADPSSDKGTVLRDMLAYLLKHGVITEYQAVPLDTASLKAAITSHGFVLCGFALPAGAESEGVKWRVPRSGKAAGSWGGHCVPLCGFSTEDFDLVSWGELGTASTGFVKDYLDEAWVLTYAEGAL